ncbi:hypothetical protein [Microbacterium sp. RURRCA19A]|uniref:hypothetical protein n=1 Tax=Microbacterium sp. RURRCA19A TaxID=1907391 RepID=UPI000955689F|nr:hypothetical protein [Microbacterium sp. RURRCA19A]SIS19732.1 hypothetical protein SAMN05880568_3476 [Microbacterium sp. RURRCA19A]
MSEHYEFEYRGAGLKADIDVDSMPTTTNAPNLRVIEGSWPTWRLEITRPEGLPPEARQFRCVDPSDPSAAHPHGNLTTAESASDLDALMIREDGYLRRVAAGEAALWPWRDQAHRDAFHTRLNS